ncbi:MBL fold metallo-hydrolase [Nocardioides dongxiaopingii]|uniref:MBL fold metallo-hydrolase n=1 Tax=Nocardioides sp. S-1144 TaxID=2582905 RepID=UPI00110D682C|nr:MBL fold metallo-hydrolase [Nocardioides sp. S-1144]QCW49731.1 MBL fold metallo-hydrolase [Nocardioides sp. S-1144]
MRLTKFGHACVRVEHDGVVVVIDPGSFTQREAVDGADVVLVTHQHPDHLDVEHLRAAGSGGAAIHTIGAVADEIRAQAPDVAERVAVVAPGDVLDVGVPVRVVGEKHAVIHADYPRIDNSGFLLTLGDQRVYHPGDALVGPGEPVDVLLAPVSAPWLKIGEAIDFVRDVAAPRTLAVHDRVYSEVGLGMVAMHMDNLALGGPDSGRTFVRLADGADLG